jgi:hypothetical protein
VDGLELGGGRVVVVQPLPEDLERVNLVVL